MLKKISGGVLILLLGCIGLLLLEQALIAAAGVIPAALPFLFYGGAVAGAVFAGNLVYQKMLAHPKEPKKSLQGKENT